MQLLPCFILVILVISFPSTVKSECTININSLPNDAPIILSANTRNFLPLHNSPRGVATVPEGYYLTLLCPRSPRRSNFFKYYPRYNELLVQCSQDMFFIPENDKTYHFDYLHCAFPPEPSVFNTNKTCYGPRDNMDIRLNNQYTTKLLVGYQTEYDFLTVYEICFDKSLIGPRYSLVTISPDIDKRQNSEATGPWVSSEDLYVRFYIDAEYVCPAQSSTFYRILSRNYFNDYARCCFQKSRLVQGQDLVYIPQQIATFTDVNTIPMCEQNNWNRVQDLIRQLAVSLDRSLNVWTGVYKILTDVSGQTIIDKELYIHYKNDMDKGVPVPHFTWKVVYEPSSERAVAIITLNDQKAARHGADGLILCRDVCPQLAWFKLPSRTDFKDGYTYCCEVGDFINGFNYGRIHPFPNIVVYEPSSERAVAIITLNDQKAARHGADGLILCRDVCPQLAWFKLPSRTDFKDGYTYCCEVGDFINGFNYGRIHPFPNIVGLLSY